MNAKSLQDLAVVGFLRAAAPRASAALAPVHLAHWPARLTAAGINGFALVTCERAEVIQRSHEPDAELRARVAHSLAAEVAGTEALAGALSIRRGRAAVRHLFRVAAGLDSRLLGEDEIAAQFAAAARVGPSLDRHLDRLVRWAKETGRRVRQTLDATGTRQSWATAAVAAIREHGAERIALVGTGRFAETLARGLAAIGRPPTVLYGSHPEHTAQVAARHGAAAKDRPGLADEWHHYDAVILATRGRVPLGIQRSVGAAPRGRPLLVDLGEPPLVDSTVGSHPGIVLLDLAALEARYHLPLSADRRAAAEAQVELEVDRFVARFRTQASARWLLAAHGSGDGSATNTAVRHLADQLAKLAGRPVEVAFRRGAPGWDDTTGRNTVRVVPLLAAAGYFSREVLPKALETARAHHITEPVGTHPWLLQGRVDATRTALSRIGWHLAEAPAEAPAAILVAGHGTARQDTSGDSAERLAALLRDHFPAVAVAVGFLDQAPTLEAAAAALLRFRPRLSTLVLVPHLLGGHHADDDVPARVAAALPAQIRLLTLKPLLAEPMLLPAVLDRFGRAAGPPLRIATRRSPLALVQAELVRAALGRRGLPAQVVPVDTAGDRDTTRPISAFATAGPFTDDLEAALRRGVADLAVHSVKDLPLDEPADLELAAFLERGPAADVMVGARLAELPPGARVGTCSPRRSGQLRRLRPDLDFRPVRGAIGERLAQLDAGHFDALVLAEAALVRLDLKDRIAERLPFDHLVPEPGQGAIALQIRRGDRPLADRLAPLDHGPTRRSVTAERDAARRAQSGGTSQVAAHAWEKDGRLELLVRRLPVSDESGGTSSNHQNQETCTGSVHLVGAGPGAPDLLTLRGLDRLRAADVVVYDRLLTPELLALAPAGAERVDVGKEAGRVTLPQRAIERLLVERARAGQVVVRLKGGDPFVFGRGAEELDACRAAGVPCEVVPGLSSAFAGPAGVGVPVTERGVARSVVVLSAHAGDDTPPLASAAHGADTLVVLMGLDRLASLSAELIAAGRPANTPAAIVSHATWSTETVRATRLGELAVAGRDLESPALVVIGPTAARARNGGSDESAGTSLGVLSGSLAGRTIALTRPDGPARRTAALLAARGARVVASPLIEIELQDEAVLASALAERLPLARYPWLVFTSKHGVAGFWRGLRAAGRDARALAGTRLAVVGPATAEALGDHGLSADLVAVPHRAEALVAALARQMLPGHRVLFSAGSRARRETVLGLGAHGIAVDELEVYTTRHRAPTPAFRNTLERGVDAVVFTSPSAVASYVEHGLDPAAADVVVCLGPTTAAEARERGFRDPQVAADHDEAGLIEALTAALTPSRRQEDAA
ncbi:MAG: uroporphyrinogen-III C-methyltransferase [Thermoanaerobaculia bacterium]|nr:uroporphyrinogen-III C-methyltransferase [Thermoanaerobaculia bacterium]